MKTLIHVFIFFFLLFLLNYSKNVSEDKRMKARERDQIEITYIMNEGFIITSKDKKIIIDGLLNFRISKEIQKKMINAETPFNDIDLIISTHDHADHFDAKIVGEHLIKNEKVIFVSTYQALEELQTEFNNFNDISNRVISVYPEKNEIISKTINGIKVKIYNLHHGLNSNIQNLGFYITIDNRHIFHVGDAQQISKDDLKPIGIDRKKIDILFIPYWFLIYDDNQEVFQDIKNSNEVIAMHLGWIDEEPEAVLNDLKTKYPKAIIFNGILEMRIF